jgi:hypothetical protein
VQFETLRNRNARVLGTGELNEQHMSGHPEPAVVSAAAFQDYRAAWTALTSPDPALVERFSESHPNANEWLKRAMQLLLRRYPDMPSGVPWWDFTLLTGVRSHGPKAARVIGHTIGDFWDDADLVGDHYLFGRLLRLGDPQLPAPLLEISGDRANMRDVQVALTPFGLDVLEGRASNYPTNPIDDWAAGVKLSSADGVLVPPRLPLTHNRSDPQQPDQQQHIQRNDGRDLQPQTPLHDPTPAHNRWSRQSRRHLWRLRGQKVADWWRPRLRRGPANTAGAGCCRAGVR